MFDGLAKRTISLSLKLDWEPQEMSVIEVEHLQKSYGDTIAVSDVSFSVEEGEIFGILGPNGAGKTTTVESVIGLREPDGGKISVLGLDPRLERDKLRNVVGVQLQESQLPDKLKVREALELYASFYPTPADSDRMLETLGLADKLETPFAKLSGGQKQRLSIALALIGRPRIAVLDELTTGLDPQARRDTWELIGDLREHGVTIVLVTHFMEEAERLADRVALIDAGRVVATGTPAALAEAVDREQRIRFMASEQFGDELLIGLPEVRQVEHRGGQVLVAGSGDVLGAVISVLAREGIVARQLRVEQANLEDAFVALTGNGSNH
jgi:ABC-2 type transport system ATP-binding protein